MKVTLFLVPFTFLLLGGGVVRADPLTIQISPNPACVTPGTCTLITVTVTNSGNMPLTIDSVDIAEQEGADPNNVWVNQGLLVELLDMQGELGAGASKVFHFSWCLAAGAPEDAFLRYRIEISYVLANGQPAETVVIGQAQAVPEPATMLLLGTGLAGFAIKTRKRLKRRKSG